MADPIADLSKWSPPQRRRLVDGEVVIEKLSPVPGPKMLDPSGNVIDRLPAANGFIGWKNDPYRVTVIAEKVAKGWVHFDRCPISSESVEHLPPSIRYHAGTDGKPDHARPKSPCTRAADGGKISNTSPCECIEALEKFRKGKQAVKEAASEERINKLAKLAERNAQAGLDATTQLAAAAQAMAEAARSATSQNRKAEK